MLRVNADEHIRLRALASAGNAPRSMAQRASIILASTAPDMSIADIADAHGTSPATVRRWQRRFTELGLAGLADAPRSGAPRRINDDVRASILDLHGDERLGLGTRQIAARTGTSQSSAARIVREAQRQGFSNTPAIRPPETEEDIEALTVALFESLADENPWTRFLEMIRAATSSRYCTLMIYCGGRLKPSLILSDEIPQERIFSYFENEQYNKELLIDLPEGKVVTLSDLMSDDALHETELYEYLSEYRIGYVLGLDIGTVRGISGKLRLSRLDDQGDYGAEERRLCQKITPYLRTALNLFVKRIDAEAERAALSATVSGMSVGSIMVDPDSRVLEANPPAATILTQRDGIFLSDGRVCLNDPKKSKYLHDLIRQNAEASLGAPTTALARSLLVDRPSGQESLSLLVRPAATGTHHRLAVRPTAIVHLVDPMQPRVTMIDALMQLFGLTPAEAKVALSLSNGLTITEIASSTQLSRNTIRSQVQSCFSKIGVERQSELIRTILISVALLSL